MPPTKPPPKPRVDPLGNSRTLSKEERKARLERERAALDENKDLTAEEIAAAQKHFAVEQAEVDAMDVDPKESSEVKEEGTEMPIEKIATATDVGEAPPAANVQVLKPTEATEATEATKTSAGGTTSQGTQPTGGISVQVLEATEATEATKTPAGGTTSQGAQPTGGISGQDASSSSSETGSSRAAEDSKAAEKIAAAAKEAELLNNAEKEFESYMAKETAETPENAAVAKAETEYRDAAKNWAKLKTPAEKKDQAPKVAALKKELAKQASIARVVETRKKREAKHQNVLKRAEVLAKQIDHRPNYAVVRVGRVGDDGKGPACYWKIPIDKADPFGLEKAPRVQDLKPMKVFKNDEGVVEKKFSLTKAEANRILGVAYDIGHPSEDDDQEDVQKYGVSRKFNIRERLRPVAAKHPAKDPDDPTKYKVSPNKRKPMLIILDNGDGGIWIVARTTTTAGAKSWETIVSSSKKKALDRALTVAEEQLEDYLADQVEGMILPLNMLGETSRYAREDTVVNDREQTMSPGLDGESDGESDGEVRGSDTRKKEKTAVRTLEAVYPTTET